MCTFRFLCLVAAGSLLMLPSNVRAQEAAPECSIDGGIANFRPADMSAVREMTVVRPDGGVVYLFSPQRGIFGIASNNRGAIELDPRTQNGSQYAEDGKLHHRKVFDAAGKYQLVVVGDAKNPDSSVVRYHRAGCVLEYAPGKGLLSAKVPQAASIDPLSSTRPCDSDQLAPLSSCRPSSSCELAGHGYCCTQTVPGEPCFCDNCCVAKASIASF